MLVGLVLRLSLISLNLVVLAGNEWSYGNPFWRNKICIDRSNDVVPSTLGWRTYLDTLDHFISSIHHAQQFTRPRILKQGCCPPQLYSLLSTWMPFSKSQRESLRGSQNEGTHACFQLGCSLHCFTTWCALLVPKDVWVCFLLDPLWKVWNPLRLYIHQWC